MNALLDTSFLIELEKGNKKTKEFLDSFEEEFYISSLTLFEFLIGRFYIKKPINIPEYLLLNLEKDDCILAAKIMAKLVRKGIFVDKIDTLLCAQAFRNNMKIVTFDEDFLKIKSVFKDIEIILLKT